MKRHAGSSIKAAHGDTSYFESEDTYDKVANSLDNLGRSLEYLLIAGVHTKATVGALRFMPQISAILSGVGFAVKMFRIYAGESDSAMMKKLKASFLEVNNKLDIITSDLKNNRNLIKYATKRAAYIDAENKILSAYENIRKYNKKLADLQCNDKSDCNSKQLLISQSFSSRFYVKKEVDLILRGSIANGVFGEPLLNLTKEYSKCDVKKIQITASIIAGLATKGQIAAMLYESITDPSFDMLSFEADFAKKLLTLEKKKNLLSKQCYDTIDRYIRSDVNYMNEKYYKQYDLQTANRFISEFLQRKYSWIKFCVISVEADNVCKLSKRVIWFRNKMMYDLAYINKDKSILSYVIIGYSSYGGHFDKMQLSSFFSDNREYVQSHSNALLYVDPCKKGIMSYPSKTGTIHTKDISKIEYNVDGVLRIDGKRLSLYLWLVIWI